MHHTFSSTFVTFLEKSRRVHQWWWAVHSLEVSGVEAVVDQDKVREGPELGKLKKK